MATIDLGKIRFNWQGAYNNSTAYVINDVVSSGGNSYICKLASTGNAVSNGTYWDLMSSAGTNGTDLTSTLTAQGDVLYRDGSGLQKLGAGTSGQFLKTQGTGANPVWADAGGAWSVKSSGTFSSASSLNITGLSKWTRIFLYNLRTNSGDLMFRTSSNNGSSYDSGGSDYQYYRHQHNGYYSSTNQAQIQTVGEPMGNTSQDDCIVTLDIPNPTGTTPTIIKWEMIHNDNTSLYHRFGSGIRSSSADVDAIQILTASGHITGNYIVTELN